jgi:hypothetical protein
MRHQAVSEYHNDPINGKKLPRRLVARGRWAVATDGIQWILQRHQGGRWRDVSFVRSTKDILARCMREKGVVPADMVLLTDLPDQFAPNAPQIWFGLWTSPR